MVIKIKNTLIKEYIEELIKKAIAEMPNMPDFTNSIEKSYVSEKYQIDGIDHIFSFYCIPPYKHNGDGLNKTMLGCELFIPSVGVAFSTPLMYEPKEVVIKNLSSEETEEKVLNKFRFLFKDFEDYDPDE